MKLFASLILLMSLVTEATAQHLPLPEQTKGSMVGSAFAKSIADLPILERERTISQEILAGNVPEFLRKFAPIQTTQTKDGKTYTITFFATPDYLSVGTDQDYFLTPLSPITAQQIASKLDCSLPTPKMVDLIYAAAKVKLVPQPIPPSPQMATVPVFITHSKMVAEQRGSLKTPHEPGLLVAGHEKDVVISAKLQSVKGKVAIYGWHKPDGKPIQPLYLGHADWYADYSHGIRLIANAVVIDGKIRSLHSVLADPELSFLLSNDGVITTPFYPEEFRSKVPEHGPESKK